LDANQMILFLWHHSKPFSHTTLNIKYAISRASRRFASLILWEHHWVWREGFLFTCHYKIGG